MAPEFDGIDKEVFYKIEKLSRRLVGLRIGSDIDNTEVASTENGLLILNKIFNTNFTLEEITDDFEIINLISENLKEVLNPKEYAINLWNSNENLSSAKPISGVLSMSRYLHKAGLIGIPRITSRPGYTRDVTYSWYQQNMPWLDIKSIYIQDGSIINPDFKIDQIKELGIDLFFEDSYQHAVRIAEETRAFVVLVPQPWNQKYIDDLTCSNNKIIIPYRDWKVSEKMVRVFEGLSDYI